MILVIGAIAAGTVTRPITAGVTVLLYVDMRMRKEGLDLALRTASGTAGRARPTGQPAGRRGPPGDDFATVWRPPSAGPAPAPGAPPTAAGAPPPW